MRYTIERASHHSSTQQPHERAVKGELLKQQEQDYTGKPYIEEYQIWYIDIDSLDELMAFIQTNGAIVIEPQTDLEVLVGVILPYPKIIIYDSYIE